MVNPSWVQPCGAGSKLITPAANPKQYQLCGCSPCWFAALYFVGVMPCPVPPPFTNVQPIQAHCTIRSNKTTGTVLTVTIPAGTFTTGWKFVKADCSTFANMSGSINVTVGMDTGGTWIFLGKIVVGGQPDVWVYINAIKPKVGTVDYADPRTLHYCEPPEFGLRVLGQLPIGSSTSQNPGPFKWRDVVAQGNADSGASYQTDADASYNWTSGGHPFGYFFTTFTWGIDDDTDTIDWFSNLPDGISPPSGPLMRCYQKSIYTPPGSAATSDLISLPVSYTQLYTGNVVDGTHVFDDTQEPDVDAVPTADIVGVAADEFLNWSSITRTSSGHYTFNNLQFICRAPSTRKLIVWPFRDHATGHLIARTQPWQIVSGDITVTIGVPDSVDVLPTASGPGNYGGVVEAGQVILNAGNPLRARILDICGESFDYNVVPTATNVIVASLSQPGTNYYGSPTLHGTTSRAAVAGLADFNDLYIIGLGRHYRLTFNSTGLFPGGTNGNFYNNISVATGLVFETLPTINAGVACSIKVDMVDLFGAALVPSAADSLTLSGAGSFSGFGSVTPTAGVATFTGSFPAAGTYTIQVVTSGVNYDGPGVAGIPAVTISVTVLP